MVDNPVNQVLGLIAGLVLANSEMRSLDGKVMVLTAYWACKSESSAHTIGRGNQSGHKSKQQWCRKVFHCISM